MRKLAPSVMLYFFLRFVGFVGFVKLVDCFEGPDTALAEIPEPCDVVTSCDAGFADLLGPIDPFTFLELEELLFPASTTPAFCFL